MTTREDQIRQRFERFHAANPLVWDLFKRFTLQLIHRGFKHYSADAIVHRIRWHAAIEATCTVAKINNCHTAHYARLFHREFPEHDGFFRNRALVSAGRPHDFSGIRDPTMQPPMPVHLVFSGEIA